MMMKNNLCRAKKYGTDKWLYGYYAECTYAIDDNKFTILIPEDAVLFPHCELDELYIVDPDTVCRCTGREDINGNLIFEGDYIRTYYGRECMVVWFSSNAHNGWDLIPIGGFNCKPPLESTIWAKENLEVIGNKFDNTELMEDQSCGL